MAFLHLAPSGKFHVGFRYAGRQWKHSLDTTNPQLAERARRRLEENLRLVEEGRLEVPVGVDVAEFLLSDGKLTFVIDPLPAMRHEVIRRLCTSYLSSMWPTTTWSKNDSSTS